ncbi:MAG: hypothetical protein K2P30_06590 [Lachnospiraceae bacterium]|nr:hypothetical protein [Lachnospiraceae bacterium]
MIKMKIPSLRLRKRVLFLPFGKAKGSMALEGSLALPLFLFFMMTVLLGLEAVRFQSNVLEALHQSGNKAAFEGYLTKYAGKERAGAKGQIREYLDGQAYPYLCVAGGAEGVQVEELSQTEGNGRIEILVEYGLKPFIPCLPIGEIRVKDRFLSHLWIGYHGDGGESGGTKEVYVYVTKTGSRYHLSVQCTYLGIRPSAASYDEVGGLRNLSGGKYYACQRCKPAKGGIVYLTKDGQAYHGRSDCSALKRTVYMIPLGEADGYGACSKCAG